MSFTQAELEKQLAELIERHHVPGAQLAVLDGDTIIEVAAGVLSLRTGCPVTTDALFLPGSIGKVYTATLVLMLADEGLIDLDSPVRSYLPDFEVRDHHARDSVTVRDLLTHTSGFDGDVFLDTGRGDDALARYIHGDRRPAADLCARHDLELQQQRVRDPRPARSRSSATRSTRPRCASGC